MERRSSERRSNNEWSERVEVTNSPSVELRTRCVRANDAHAGPGRPNQARKGPIWKLACNKEVILRSWGVLAFSLLQQDPNFIQIPHSAEITNTHQDSHSKTPLANWTLNSSSRGAVGRGLFCYLQLGDKFKHYNAIILDMTTDLCRRDFET